MEAVQRFLLILTLYCIMTATTFGQSTSPATRNGENWDDIYDTSASNSATATFTSFGTSVVSNIQSSTLQFIYVTSKSSGLYITTSSSYFFSPPQFESNVLSSLVSSPLVSLTPLGQISSALPTPTPNEPTPVPIPSLHYLVLHTYQISSSFEGIPDPNVDTNVNLILNAISAIYNNITMQLGGEAVGISDTSYVFNSGLIRKRTVIFYVVDNPTFVPAFEVKEILDRASNTDWENTIQLNDPSAQLAVINVTISCLYPCTVASSSSQHFSILPTGSMLTTTVAATMNATQPLISTTSIPSLIQTMTSSILLRETASTVSVSQPSLLLSRTIQSTFATQSNIPMPSAPSVFATQTTLPISNSSLTFSTQATIPTQSPSLTFSTQATTPTQSPSLTFSTQATTPTQSPSLTFSTQATIPTQSPSLTFSTQATIPTQSPSLTFSTQVTTPTQSLSLTFSTQATIPTQSPPLAFVTQTISTLLLSPSSELVTQTILSTPGLSAERSLQSSIPVLSQSSVFASQTTTPMPLPSSGVISLSSVLINPSSIQLSSSHVMTSSPSRSLSDTMILSTRPSSVFISSMLGQTVSTLPAVETATSAVLTPFPSLSSQTPLASISTTSPISSTLTTGWDYIQIPDFDPGVGYLLLLTVTSSNISAQSDPLFYLNTELKLINLYTIALSKNVGIRVNNNRKKRDVFNTTSMLAAGIIESRSQIDSNTLKIVFYVSQGQPNISHRFIPANESLVTYNKLVAQEYNSILTDLSFISIEIYSDPILFQTMTAIIVGSILGCCVLLLLVFLIFTVLYHCLHSTRNVKWSPERDLSLSHLDEVKKAEERSIWSYVSSNTIKIHPS